MRDIKASVVGSFPVNESGSGVSIEPDLEPYADDAIHLLVYPTTGVNVHASIGEVTVGDVKSVRVPSGIATFGGGAVATLPHPPYQSSPDFRILYALDTEGNTTSIGLRYDGAFNVLTATEDCHAGVSYTSYMTAARRISYRPLRRPFSVGFELEFGMVLAFKTPRGPVATYEVRPFNVINGNAVYELYRITSSTVTTRSGEFEKPPNWPTDGNYTDPPATALENFSLALETQRVHEIGYMDESGRGWANSYYVSALEPYVGNNNYTIPKTNRIATISQFPRNLQQKALEFIASRGLGPR